MGRTLRGGVFSACLFAFATPAWPADPILMLLIGMAREMMVSKAIDAANAPEIIVQPELAYVYPGTTVQPDHLRRLIEDSFMYLSERQRGEVFDTLHAELLKPKNVAVRGAMIEYFAEKALAVRAAQLRLAQLSRREKELLAEDFRKEVAALSVREQAELGEVLRQGLLPVPGDLGQLLRAALER